MKLFFHKGVQSFDDAITLLKRTQKLLFPPKMMPN